MRRAAVIDVGTNSVLLLVAERGPSGFSAVDEDIRITRLGRGVDRTRVLAPEAMDETLAAVAEFATRARSLGAEALWVTATSAARDAKNGGEFLARARTAAGVEVEILSGDDEAAAVWASASRDFGPGPLTVIDVGGGSTEIVHGEGDRVTFRRSLDVGSVRLTERHLKSDPPTAAELAKLRSDLAGELTAIPPAEPGAVLVGIAGTVTTLATIAAGVTTYDGSVVHGRVLQTEELRAIGSRLASLPLHDRRKVPGLPEKRADVIVAGAEIVAAVAERLGFPSLTVSDRGVRWGVLYARMG